MDPISAIGNGLAGISSIFTGISNNRALKTQAEMQKELQKEAYWSSLNTEEQAFQLKLAMDKQARENSKNTRNMLIVGAVILVLVGGGLYLYKTKKAK